MMEATLSATVR